MGLSMSVLLHRCLLTTIIMPRRGLSILMGLIVATAAFPSSAVYPAPTQPARPRDTVYSIPVKILVDDKEPTVRRLWEKRCRDRVAAASNIIERCCQTFRSWARAGRKSSRRRSEPRGWR
jgi:hypothetical protein